MQQNIEQLPVIKLVGIKARTSNAFEANQDTAKIGKMMQSFFTHGLQSQIPNRKISSKLFAVYTDYESDEHGPYTYFLGVEVDNFVNVPQNFDILTVPVQTYTKFTLNPGKIPEIVIDAWQNIWQITESSLGGKRAYIADFEIYDERNHDPQEAVIDIYIGIKQKT